MTPRYEPQEIEAKWQRVWEDERAFNVPNQVLRRGCEAIDSKACAQRSATDDQANCRALSMPRVRNRIAN